MQLRRRIGIASSPVLLALGLICSSCSSSSPPAGTILDGGLTGPGDGLGWGDTQPQPPGPDVGGIPPGGDGGTPPSGDGGIPPGNDGGTPPGSDGGGTPNPDGATADVGTPPGDGGSGAALKRAFKGKFYEHTLPAVLDVGTLVTGGVKPYACTFYAGPGRGTLPGGMSIMSGCELTGGFGSDDPPGVYGFVVVLSDKAGAKVSVPVAIRNGSCNKPKVTLTPPEYPVRTGAPGSAYKWDWKIDNVNTPCSNPPSCTDCGGCVKFAVGTKTPLKGTWALDCKEDGDVCLSGGNSLKPASCPNTTAMTWAAVVRVKTHAPLRSDGGPAWVTVRPDATYSGDVSAGFNCGNKQWACHVEVFEQ